MQNKIKFNYILYIKMLSFSFSDVPIATIKEGEFKDKVLYYHDKIDESKKIKTNNSLYLNGDIFKDNRKNLKLKDINRIYKAIENDYEINNDEISEYYNKSKNIVEIKNKKELKLKDGIFQVIPAIQKNQRQCILVTGPSGVGKSTWTSKYAKEYHQDFPNNPIYLISKKTSDPEFDKFKYITRIELDEDFATGEPLQPEDLKNSLVIFDDIENISDDNIKNAVYKLKDNLLETGRDKNIYMVIAIHMARNNKCTRTDNNESSAFVLFKGGNSYHNKRYLKEYIGLDSKGIQRILDLPSRWVYINKTFPMYVVSESECYLL